MKLSIKNEIVEVLEKHLIKPEGGLQKVYDRIFAYHKASQDLPKGEIDDNFRQKLHNCLKPLLSTKDLQNNFFQSQHSTTFAIDFPIEISSKKEERERIMICTMDPLPPDDSEASFKTQWKFYFNKDDYKTQLKSSISIWSPFSLLDNWDAMLQTSQKGNIIFFKTLFEKYDLYVTDIYKLFYRTEKKRSSQISSYCSKSVHQEILEKEIEIVQPKILLLLGNNAINAYKLISGLPLNQQKNDLSVTTIKQGSFKIVSAPHLSNAANGAKKNILENDKYKDIVGNHINEKYAKVVLKNLK